MIKNDLGNRMKGNYENISRFKLIRRMPVIIRLDGKAFHTLTRNCNKPFDTNFINSMLEVAKFLLFEIQGVKLIYVQSDEISILLTDYDKLETDAWFDYNLQKMVSVSAGMASVKFSTVFKRIGIFDSRAFNIPKEEVSNYFIWRYKDWLRNSLSMYSRNFYTQKELNNKKQNEIHEMLFQKNVNWSKLPEQLKNGTLFYKREFGFNKIYPSSVDELRNVVEQVLK